LDPACRAAERAAWLAVALKADLTFLAVAREAQSNAALDAYRHSEGLGDEPVPLLASEAESCLVAAQNRALAMGMGKTTRLIRTGNVAQTLLSVATEVGADTIILGRHNHSDLRRSVVGSVSRKIVGSFCVIWGSFCVILGNSCVILGNSCVIVGSLCVKTGSSCVRVLTRH
jgi:nucleotide-binding universal stress UspA family protein